MEPDDARRSNLEALADRLLSPSRAGGREACGWGRQPGRGVPTHLAAMLSEEDEEARG